MHKVLQKAALSPTGWTNRLMPYF